MNRDRVPAYMYCDQDGAPNTVTFKQRFKGRERVANTMFKETSIQVQSTK